MILHGDCLEQLKTLPDNSIDSIVTDPPYGLNFMGKKWDYDVPSVAIWQECLRVIKPGGHLLSFGGTRTYHRLVVNIEDAGFEIRDCIQWLYGSGFPKSTDVSKRIDKEAGAPREVLGTRKTNDIRGSSVNGEYRPLSKNKPPMDFKITTPSTDSAKQWQGWGTALKPANEIICMAVKPLTDKDLLTNLVRECQSKLFVLIARNHLASNQKEFDEASNIVQWIAGKHTLTQVDLSELTAMLQLESKTNSNLSTGLSWLDTLDEVLRHGSTFTTETESSLITDLKILKSYLLKNMQASTPQNDGPGNQWNASLVKSLLNALELKLSYILTPSAQDSVTSKAIALSPNNEPICVARKPLEKGLTVAENVLKWGTGALNIDASRIVTEEKLGRLNSSTSTFNHKNTTPLVDNSRGLGRWPANIILDEEAAQALDEQSGTTKSGKLSGNEPSKNTKTAYGEFETRSLTTHGDSGGASRFFYVAKASKRERNEGLDSYETIAIDNKCKEENTVAVQLLQKVILESTVKWSIDECGKKITALFPKVSRFIIETEINKTIESKILNALMLLLTNENTQDVLTASSPVESVESLKKFLLNITNEKTELALGAANVALKMLFLIKEKESSKDFSNFHSTVKPTKLMEYLIKLVTPPNGTVLDPFMGSGSTGVAAKKLGFEFVGCEMNEEYFQIAEKRIELVG